MKTFTVYYLTGILYLLGINELTAQTWSAVSGSINTGSNVLSLGADNVNNVLYVGGTFTKVGTGGGLSATNVAKWNGSSWSALGSGCDNSVYALCMYNGNLYAGGWFATAGGVTVNYVAMWNGAVWSALSVGTGMYVYSLCEFNGELYVGGAFSSAGSGVSNTRGIAKWNGSTSTWSAVANGYPGGTTVNTMYVYGGELYIGVFNGSTYSLDKWNGSALSTVKTVNNSIMAFTDNGTTLYEGGWFFSPDPNYVAQGLTVAAVGSPGMNDGVRGMAYYSGSVYAGGRFTTSGGITTNYVAAWNGSAWSAVDNGMNAQVYALAVCNGVLYAGGYFTSAGSGAAKYLARITIVLPIELTLFTGKNENGKNILEWNTSSETNNDYFIVERDKGQGEWESIGKVKGSGNLTTAKNYSFTDANPLRGINYYRLKQMDYNGHSGYSKILEVNSLFEESYFNVYPNPSNGTSTFSGSIKSSSSKEVLVAVTDITGRQVYSKIIPVLADGTFRIAFDYSKRLSPGVYFVTVTSDNEVYNQKLYID